MDWHIDGRDVFIQDWETREEMSVQEAEDKLNRFAQLEAELAKEKETVTFLDASLDIKQRLVVAENQVSQLEAENNRYRDALYSIAGTNTKPSHLKIAWKEMMLVTKQRAKEALGGE